MNINLSKYKEKILLHLQVSLWCISFHRRMYFSYRAHLSVVC